MDTKTLQEMLLEVGNLTALSKRAYVSVRTLRRIRNGHATSIHPATEREIWRALGRKRK